MFTLTVFLPYVLITTFTPGPNNLMSMYNAGTYGFKKTLPFELGIFLGFFLVMASCGIFSLALYSYLPAFHSFMTAIGSVYILYLAWKIWQEKPEQDTNRKKATNNISSGFLMQFINPKVILYGLTLFSTFILPYTTALPVLLSVALFLATMALISNSCWALFGSLFKTFLTTHYTWVNRIMALLLVYCAISLFI
ncbi:LysE family transporter [uncultured Sphaerochaeta sp.]|uniref:LysE family transporter n=1 Tax=uncultured Sphaerochaeta sp. TaxID=886478 RepID=UPI002A0A87BA|nr:LysE family transporter [uncultured Sphaerochaeta sp.]